MKTNKLWVKVGRVAFTCNTIEEAANRVKMFFQNWYSAGLCNQSDVNDWNIWSNRRTKTGGRKHVANIQFGEVA
jgi:hypothetical protein